MEIVLFFFFLRGLKQMEGSFWDFAGQTAISEGRSWGETHNIMSVATTRFSPLSCTAY